jgi:hypothetical protein
MRVLLLAAGAAVVVLGVVVLIGLRVVGDDAPSWAERANTACEGGIADTRALIGAAGPAASADERALRIYAGSVEVEAGVLARLEDLPRPAGDEVAIGQILRVISESHREDLVLVAQLRRNYDAEVLRQRLEDVEPLLPYLRSSFESLGAPECVAYYDPATYE